MTEPTEATTTTKANVVTCYVVIYGRWEEDTAVDGVFLNEARAEAHADTLECGWVSEQELDLEPGTKGEECQHSM